MQIIKAWQWTKEDSVAMAIYAAELVIDYYEMKSPNDSGPRKAIEAAKAWIANPTQDAADAADAAADAAAYAARAATYAAYAARLEMKKKIQKWIIARLKEQETL